MFNKNKKERLKFTPCEEDRVLVTEDGKKYRFLKEVTKGEHISEIIFEEFNEEELNNKINKIADYLIDKSGLDSKTIVKNILRQMETGLIDKIGKEIQKEAPVIIEPGCLSLKIGKHALVIVE